MLTTAPHLEVRRPSPTTAEFTVTTCPPPTISNRLLLALVFVLRVLLAASVLFLLYLTWPLATLPASTSTTTTTSPEYAQFPGCLPTGPSHQTIEYNTSEPYNNYPSTIPAAPSSVCASPSFIAPMPTTLAQLALASTNTNNENPATSTATASLFDRPTTLLTSAWLPYLLALLAHTNLGLSLARLSTTLPPSLLYPLSAGILYLAILWRIHTTESLLVLRGLGIQTTSSSSGATLALALAGGAGAGGGSTTRFIPTEKIRDVLINEAFRGFAVRYYLVVVVDGEEDVVVVFPRLLPGRRIVERVWRGVRGCLWEPQEGGWDSGG